MAPADEDGVGAGKHLLYDADLVGHLGAAEHDYKRSRRVAEQRAEHLQLALHE